MEATKLKKQWKNRKAVPFIDGDGGVSYQGMSAFHYNFTHTILLTICA